METFNMIVNALVIVVDVAVILSIVRRWNR